MKPLRILTPLALLGLGTLLAGCGGTDAPPMATAAQLHAATLANDTSAQPVHETMVIATPDMLGSNQMPAYIPSQLVLPANSDVVITVVNFDDATALPAAEASYAVPTGIVGGLTVEPLSPADPNAAAPATTVSSLDPATGVSHTFTVAALHLNVPIAPKSRTTFTIHTGDAGTYTWQCMDPCGTDPGGWGGAMQATGYMRGTLTVS